MHNLSIHTQTHLGVNQQFASLSESPLLIKIDRCTSSSTVLFSTYYYTKIGQTTVLYTVLYKYISGEGLLHVV